MSKSADKATPSESNHEYGRGPGRGRSRTQATLDVRALERFLNWALRYNQRALDACQQQHNALLAAMEVVTGRAAPDDDSPAHKS